MKITDEDKNELKNLIKIATNQIPRYFNVINSVKENWQIENINEFIFGMVFEKYIHDSGQYLSNKEIDEGQSKTIENSMEAYNFGLEIFSDHILDIKRQIQEN
ncbi:MAG: hypothetical protein OEM79_01270 [Nitrosopumilus sp.]|nr:hypothetical protein [Nitrosopumilus sp.]